ncbi:MAG: hypothetical protein QRY16_13845, partial [Enterobacterales bacterium endosymbiont of Blomia tropicalis]|uniref:hypothetical protein n=1 Tax=Mixta mediterraneensis TaxID=2758443 RepID=UPI0025A6EEE8
TEKSGLFHLVKVTWRRYFNLSAGRQLNCIDSPANLPASLISYGLKCPGKTGHSTERCMSA